MEYTLNPKAKYYLPTIWTKYKGTDIGLSKLRIYINNTDSFEVRNLDIFTNYVITFLNKQTIDKWLSKCDMSFYQNQLNFAVWCATTGSGVGMSLLNNSKEKLLSSVYKFHVYYQTRKILEEMSCPIPGDKIFDPLNIS